MIYVLNMFHKSINKKSKKNELPLSGQILINDAKYISYFANIKKSNSISEINKKLTNFFEVIKKYKMSVSDTFKILEEVIGSKDNKWIIDEVYNYDGKYKINDLVLSKYVGEILYSDRFNEVDRIYRSSPNLRRVILDSVFNKIKENNKNMVIEALHDVS